MRIFSEEKVILFISCPVKHLMKERSRESATEKHSGGYSVGDPPLPIPNREVKPNHVDGTA